MAYFSNGTEGDMYCEQWCDRCVHQEPGCTVWLLHMLYNYDECNNKDSMLHKLIPIRADGFADKCTMFMERTNVEMELNVAMAIVRAYERSGLDISPCQQCGEPVVCLPDGMPMCERCGSASDEAARAAGGE